MGGAPVIEWVRPGVGFTSQAAASFRRAEAEWRALTGRDIDCNSSYRDYGLQLSMWQAWTAWTEGRGPKPNHSRALHPDASVHCRGEALDSDDWTSPGFIALMARHGWIRTAASDPTERHHFEYQAWRDQHRNEPAGNAGTPITPEGFLMALSDTEQEDLKAKVDLITRIIADPKPRQGGTMGGTATLEGLIQWYDHNMLELRGVTQAQHDVTRGFLVGQGQAMHDVTRRYLADVTSAAVARLSPGASVDQVRAAVEAAVQQIPAPSLSDAQVTEIGKQLTASAVAGIDQALRDDFDGVRARLAQLPAETLAALKAAL